MHWGRVTIVSCMILAPVALLLLVHAAAAPVAPTATVATNTATVTAPAPTAATTPNVAHVPLPTEVRGIYWTASTAAGKRGQQLIDFMTQTGLNTAVIDTQIDGGWLAFAPNDPSLAPYAESKPVIKDLDGLLKQLGDKGIYRIARIVVMKDNAYAAVHPEDALKTKKGNLWRDTTGAVWLDPGAPGIADYVLKLAHEVYLRGFDEVQFDYVRFASDGSVSSIVYPVTKLCSSNCASGKVVLKDDVMKAFFDTVGGGLQKASIPVSFDVFGQVFQPKIILNVGQRLDYVEPDADFLSPMTYPSHYAPNSMGHKNPADFPYDIIYQTLTTGETYLQKGYSIDPKTFAAKIRPWIQDFNIGATYDVAKIDAEIQAVRDAGGSGFLIWNAGNKYHAADFLPPKTVDKANP